MCYYNCHQRPVTVHCRTYSSLNADYFAFMLLYKLKIGQTIFLTKACFFEKLGPICRKTIDMYIQSLITKIIDTLLTKNIAILVVIVGHTHKNKNTEIPLSFFKSKKVILQAIKLIYLVKKYHHNKAFLLLFYLVSI